MFVPLVVGVVEVEVEAGQSDDPGDNGDRQGLPANTVDAKPLLSQLIYSLTSTITLQA